jgi:drug/metabolite transporter (DMT)-like permease
MNDSFGATRAARPLLGVLLVVLATLTFGLADTATKHLAMLYPVPVVLAVRYLVNVLLLAAIYWPSQRSRLWQSQRTVLVLLRGLCLAAASLTMGWALQLMPVGETVAIIYLSPFAVMLLASPLLGEKVSTVGWAGAAFGFVGVLLIARPGGNLDPTGVFFALLNAGLATAYHLLTRLLSRTETMASMLFHTAWVGAAIFCALAIPELGGFAPSAVDVGLMLVLGGLATAGHFLFTAAYREAPASLLAPVNYLHLVWADGLGWLVFGHLPDGWALAGMALVAGAGAAVALNSHLEQRKAKSRAAAVLDEPLADAP